MCVSLSLSLSFYILHWFLDSKSLMNYVINTLLSFCSVLLLPPSVSLSVCLSVSVSLSVSLSLFLSNSLSHTHSLSLSLSLSLSQARTHTHTHITWRAKTLTHTSFLSKPARRRKLTRIWSLLCACIAAGAGTGARGAAARHPAPPGGPGPEPGGHAGPAHRVPGPPGHQGEGPHPPRPQGGRRALEGAPGKPKKIMFYSWWWMGWWSRRSTYFRSWRRAFAAGIYLHKATQRRKGCRCLFLELYNVPPLCLLSDLGDMYLLLVFIYT